MNQTDKEITKETLQVLTFAIWLCIIGALLFWATYSISAVWTDTPPKVQPDKAKFLLARAEEGQRNITDHNSIEYKVCVQAAAQLNKYILNFRADIDKDGIVDQNDVAIVTKALGNNGNGIKLGDLK